MKTSIPSSTDSFSQTHYKLLLDSVTDYIYTVTIKKGEVVGTLHGPACFNVTGYTSEELESDEELWFTMVHEMDKKIVLDQAFAARVGKTIREVEHRIIHKNGSVRWVRNTIVVRFDSENEVIGYDGLIRDITDRKSVELALRESEQRYKRLVDSVTDYIYTVHFSKGKAVKTDHGPVCQKVTGYTSKEYDEDPDLWHEMMYKDDKKEIIRFINQALKGEETAPFEHRIIHKDGSIRWVRNTIVLRKDLQGNVYAYDGLISDITDRKRAEELAEIQKRQLIQAEKMVTLGILVSGVAHEINNPNNFIMLNGRMLQKIWTEAEPILYDYVQKHGKFYLAGLIFPDEKDQIQRLLESVQDGGKRIQKIVTSLKDFARQDTGELRFGVRISDVINQAILIVSNLISKSTNRFIVEIEQDLPPIKGNFQKLEQVIINLITNSCQALSSRSDLLKIKVFQDLRKGKLHIKVIDEGRGIPEDVKKHMFDPFFTTKRDSGGTGLGLSISYAIIKDHFGELYFERVNNQTIAHILLPLN
jgi:PAS domain S-box-containing protein